MKTLLGTRLATGICLATLVTVAAGSALAQTPADSSFETPALGTGNFSYRYADGTVPAQNTGPALNPTNYPGLGWTFLGGAGIAANGSAFGVSNNGGAPDGTQVAFLQSGDGTVAGSSFTSTFFTLDGTPANTPGSYTLSFFVAGRDNNGGQQSYSVSLVDGSNNVIPVIATAFTTQSSPFTQVSATFTATSNVGYQLQFIGLGGIGGDQTAFFDGVNISSVPEPGTILGGLLAVGLVAEGWRRRRMARPAKT